MNVNQIRKLQYEYGGEDLKRMQDMILSGDCWKMEGYYGRTAMSLLEDGVCFLPSSKEYNGDDRRGGVIKDYWGNIVPFRDQLKPGTKGTLENATKFWENNHEPIEI
jgi:hypothetical protein